MVARRGRAGPRRPVGTGGGRVVGRGPRACPAWGLGEMVKQMARIDLLVAPRIPHPKCKAEIHSLCL